MRTPSARGRNLVETATGAQKWWLFQQWVRYKSVEAALYQMETKHEPADTDHCARPRKFLTAHEGTLEKGSPCIINERSQDTQIRGTEYLIMEPPLPSLQALRILDVAARLHSYTKAADELGLTHGAVSHQIKGLESWVNAPLFTRAGKQMHPTEAALALLARTRTAIGILGEAFGHPVLRAASDGLVVATTPGVARLWLIPRLHRAAPGLIRSVRASPSFENPLDSDVDAYLRYGNGGWSGLQSALLGCEFIAPVGTAAFREAIDGGQATLADLPLLVSPFQTWRSWFPTEASGTVKLPSPTLELSDIGLVIDAATAGLGVALAPMRLVDGHLRRGDLMLLSERSIPDVYGYHLAWRPTSRKTDSLASLLDWMAREFS